MSLRLPTLLFVVVLVFAFTIAEAGPEASHDHDHEDDHDHDHEEPHDHAEDCPDACTAVADGDSDTIKDFVEEEHEICDCECNNNGWTPLLVAAKYGCPACIDHLITAPSSCSIGVTNKGGNTALHIAAKDCKTAVVKKLLKLGADVNAKNNVGATPCGDSSCDKVTKLLEAAGATGC